eukprot:7893022-Pyramimonas_sp.AAC.1
MTAGRKGSMPTTRFAFLEEGAHSHPRARPNKLRSFIHPFAGSAASVTRLGPSSEVLLSSRANIPTPTQEVQMLSKPAACNRRKIMRSWSQACWVRPLLGATFLPVNQYGVCIPASTAPHIANVRTY